MCYIRFYQQAEAPVFSPFPRLLNTRASASIMGLVCLYLSHWWEENSKLVIGAGQTVIGCTTTAFK